MIDVERRASPPSSLANHGKYDGGDVRKALHEDFLRKCYLCEEFIELGGFQVDHRTPKSSGGPKFLWKNLFPACGRCNGRRRRTQPKGGLASPGESVEQRIVQRAVLRQDLDLGCEFSARDPSDVPATNAAAELTRIHGIEHGDRPTDNTEFALRDLHAEIHDHYLREVRPLEVQVRRGRRDGTTDPEKEDGLRRQLSRRGRFSMLMRSLVHASISDLLPITTPAPQPKSKDHDTPQN